MNDYGIARDNALKLLEQYLHQENLRKHCLATEAVMRGLAKRLDQDEEMWALAGLLHDLDYNETKDDITRHGLVTAKILEEKGVRGEIIDAIKAHNAENLGITRTKPIHFAITAGETITGLIVATTLIYPDKKIKSVKPKSIVKRMGETSFARNVSRSKIMLCEKLGLALPDFVNICLNSMAEIDKDLGLV
ncbi:MAG: HDIG domain-containing protein [Deltaproteobacteria bacterium]|nr:HDIG domain-containing protein [Deltaproteobacteria bacterium]